MGGSPSAVFGFWCSHTIQEDNLLKQISYDYAMYKWLRPYIYEVLNYSHALASTAVFESPL